eukprot:CAMPEP_0183798542 /NCGR_PEP_ID=MMETSP0803_2-20130417/19119_1 /TAXON_ID=195967 /ORGANISM="Crustomastix stigmata, Strain CCMP3273" /LENGTH=4519 /DNA_ID=CAMNT_0026043227 /DNA_START=42 /DNA_END=13598 /DNA_ORIENTATION=-
MDARGRWICVKLSEGFDLKVEDVEKTLHEKYEAELTDFYKADGPPKLVFFHQVPEEETEDGEFVPVGTKPELFLTSGEMDRLKGKAVYFIRSGAKDDRPKPVGEKTVEQDIAVGEINGSSALDTFRSLVSDLFLPILSEQEKWGKNTEENTQDFMANANKFSNDLNKAVSSLHGGVELRKPDKHYVDTIELRQQMFNKAASDPEIAKHFEEVLADWCTQVEKLLEEGESNRNEPEDVGPDSELQFWRSRSAKFNSITEQLRSKECKLVMGVTLAGRSKERQAWKNIDMKVTDAANEAKDNVKYLGQLEKSFEPMKVGTPQGIIDTLPTLLSNIKMMHSIARYFNTPERMTTLFVKVTNAMITNCKDHILAPGKLWEQDKPSLLKNLDVAIKLNEAYQEQYKLTRDRLLSQPKGKQFDFGEQRIFSKFDLFCKRIGKLIDMFTTIHQFSELAQHTHIDGLEDIIKNFFVIVDEFKGKNFDLLDYTKNAFDKEFLEFNVQINDLETALQGFINSSFENITSTEHALKLLRQFQAILQRDQLKSDLDDKYQLIFQNYGIDLTNVQRIYERYKHSPPLPRNAPPVAGDIMWSRQLLRRIDEPMRKFQTTKYMNTKESKRVVKTFNRVAKALLEFETLWHQAWVRSIDDAKAGLQATLIVKHPENGQLLVNFDKEIMQLMRETKYLQRMGIEVPESAKMVLLQEEKFKQYYNNLSHALKEHDRVMSTITATVKPLLEPHLEDLEKKIQPGMFILTWTSMNIDAYLHRIHNGLAKLEELIEKINDILDNRIETNLKIVSRTPLIHLPADESFTYEEFVATQTKFVKRQAEKLIVKNSEISRAVQELCDLCASYPRDNMEVAIPEANVAKFTEHYSNFMYSAILEATKASFNAMKKRLGSRSSGGFLFVERPFFDVDVELSIPDVSMSPSLEEIQGAINSCAKRVLKCSDELKRWDGNGTFYHKIACDREIVKSVLLLTGSIEGTKMQVMEYISRFNKYDFLWLKDLSAEYSEFMKTKPSLEQFELELKKYMAIEQEIADIPPVHNIGSLSLETALLKYSLKNEAVNWKQQFAQNLHEQGFKDLKKMHEYMRETTLALNRKTTDLEDVRSVMHTLAAVREKESEIDSVMSPIEEVYTLLQRYEVRVPKEQLDMVSDLQPFWDKLRKLASDVSDSLARLQGEKKKELLKDVKQFTAEAKSFRSDWEANGPMVPGLDPMDAVNRLKAMQALFEQKKRRWDNISSGEELFGLPITTFPELEKTEKELANLDRLYSLYMNVITTIDGYKDVLWTVIKTPDGDPNIDSMTETVAGFQAQCKKMPKALREWQAYRDCKSKVDDFNDILPLLQSLAHPAMRPRHWEALNKITGMQLNPFQEDIFKLEHVLEENENTGKPRLLENLEEIEELAGGAVKEEQVELKLDAIETDWSDQVFQFAEYKNKGPVILLSSALGELMEKLEDSQMALNGLATNRYSAPFKDKVNTWQMKLSTVNDKLEQWQTVQSLWTYMESVFSGGDIVKQLPQEAKRFATIDKNYMKVVEHATTTRDVVNTCYGNEVMKNLLPHLQEQLELCQKSLTQFLDTKRAEFPRFYFVSDSTLLECLSLGSDPQAVTPHFQAGLFDSVTNVKFDKVDKNKMLEMYSQQGEAVKFVKRDPATNVITDNPVQAQGNIEVWLQALVDGMQEAVRTAAKVATDRIAETSLEEFIFNQPAQISLFGIQYQWTADMQGGLALAKNDKTIMSKTMKKTEQMLREMVVMTVSKEMTKNERKNLETCITVHMHQRDTSEELIKKKVKDPADFDWMKQCRVYWKEQDNMVQIRICDVDFEYSYEYLGVKERLVITPLTDICYVTLSQALGMFLGGAPAGPAGTGKTETTKDMGNTLGKYVVVFNCSDQFDHKYMGKIYRGLAQSGLWGCFDEFNRINLDVLSVCAQQVNCVLQAIRNHEQVFTFVDGAQVSLDERVGYFITMNPGYAGRQELPENLKSLFRGVTMMLPNRQIIKTVKLAACGYEENAPLGKKFFVLYGLCEQQLSKQAHYDFGLRNILSVLRTMGSSKRANPDKSETFLVMRTLRDMNMSKFVAEDVPLFLSLIDDLFPGLKADKAVFPEVEDAMKAVALEAGLQLHPTWLSKCVQLYETYLVRHGIMLVGPTGAGKTAISNTLCGALSRLDRKHVIARMNPKAITAPQMFGRMDAASGDWTDGVFAVLWRKAAKNNTSNTWIMLDGPVDAIWIENLNTVLDDNKVLTLANGDRVQMTGAMKAMFEPENLNNASPATVSRAGIIYVSDTELGWRPKSKSWLDTRRKEEGEILSACFDKFVGPLLDTMRLKCRPICSGIPWPHVSRDFCAVTSLCTLLDGMLKDAVAENEIYSEGHYERIFIYCITWALGGMLPVEERQIFDEDLRSLTDNAPRIPEGEEGTVFDYLVNEENTEWDHWSTRVPSWEYPKSEEKPKFAQLVIPTLDSVRFEALLQTVYSVGGRSLLVGGAGTTKTTVINTFLKRFNPEEVTSKSITFSSLTTPNIFQFAIEASVDKRSGKNFGPPGGKKMVVFVDDLSMPSMNEWGDQVTNEVVRQLFEQGGMYALEKPIGDLRFIVDTFYVAAMSTPGGGKNDIPNRMKRHMCIFNVPLPAVASIQGIFGTLVAGRFDPDIFDEETVEASSKLVTMTINLWNKVQTKMVPTPAKFHYLFNMRELSKVFQGVVLGERDRFKKGTEAAFGGKVETSAGYLAALWRHECERVFCDKLITLQDKEWAENLIMELIKTELGPEIHKQQEERLFFVDFLREPILDEDTGEPIDANPSFYEACKNLDDLRSIVNEKQDLFNQTSKALKLDLVLFTDAMYHLMRIGRLFCMDRGSALLVGVGGSGKQSLARLAAYISGCSLTFQIVVTKTYNQTNLFEDIKGMYKIAGFKGQKVAFIFTDAEVKEEGFLEFINQILMTGEVAGLFPKDEMDMMVNDMRPVMKKEAPTVADTYDNLYDFFLGRVRDNLHVCLCFSPVGSTFSRRASQFPGLINGCTIDWFLPWPVDALVAVSTKFIGDFQMACSEDVKTSLQLHMGQVHNSVTAACTEYFDRFRRHVYVTPKSYLSFISGYKELYGRKLSETRVLADKINSGLEKLFEAKHDVAKMKGELAIKNADLAEAQRVSAALLTEITESTAIATKEAQKVQVIVDAVTAKADEISKEKADAEKDLAAAQPALDAATQALSAIKPTDIQNLKALAKPPELVTRIFDCVVLLKILPMNKVSWTQGKECMVVNSLENFFEVSKKMMSDMGFLNSLMTFPKERINDETCELLMPYFRSSDFTFEAAQKASGSVAGLCDWCKAMKTYHEVAKIVEPKQRALRAAEAELKVAMKEKGAAEANLKEVQDALDKMKAQFDAAMAEKQRLEDDAAATQKKMDSANALIGALSGEEVRWTEQSKEFDDQIQRLTGDCALASSFVSYLGPFNKEFRELLLERDFTGDCQSREIPLTVGMNPSKFLVDDAEVGEWNLQGLPTDDLSTQNGIMVTRATRYPILVDPQGQGLTWIKRREAANQPRVTNLNEGKQFRMALEDCLSYGRPMIIENIEEELDPVLDPVLEKRYIKKGKGFMIALADKEVDYSEEFMLYCTTRLPNPHYSPELSAKVTVIDFTVTMVGLEDQLLGRLILMEKQELEQQRLGLIEEVTSYKKKIKQLEDDLLFRLSNSTGNLLDDTELIDVLANTKLTAAEVNEKLGNASETNAKITEACEEFRPVAHRAALIYFLIAEFSTVNCMYQTSLFQFQDLYRISVERSDKAAMPAKRINNIIEHLTYHVYLYMQRGLFEKHKLIFAFMLTNKIKISAGDITADEVNVFLKGGGSLDINAVRKKSKEWISDTMWLNLVALSSVPSMHDILDSVYKNDGLWRQWYDLEAPEEGRIPDYEEKATKFERLCIVKALREDRALIAAAAYIADALGQRFVEAVPLNMESTWEESTTKIPLICLLSPGADPTKLIDDLAKKKKIKVNSVSMGQGQEKPANRHFAVSTVEGQWVLLQNTHLGLNYLTDVEARIVKESDEWHDDFRLWITAEPHPQFPIGLLQMSIKITNEAPVGMRAGLRNSYAWVSQDMLDAVGRQEWRQLLFVMCFMHSIVQERRKFGPIGWNIRYEFNQSDLSACAQFLQNHVTDMDQRKVPEPTWLTVRYMVSSIQYGGRITDDFDQLLMDVYAELYFRREVMEKNFELFPGYKVPDSNEIGFFRAEIEKLPMGESPEIYGLHPNADLSFRKLQVNEAVATIMDTMPKAGGGGGGMSREEVVDKICEDLLTKVPKAFGTEDTKDKLKKLKGGPTQPLTVFLRQEIDRLNVVINLATKSFKNLRLAIAGTIALSGDLVEALDALFDAKVPPAWLKKSWESGTFGAWFTGLLQRYDQLHKWLNNDRPKGYWLTGWFNPQGFLTAMKQEVNRRHTADKWALDDVVMTAEVTHPPKEFETLKEAPQEGVYVYGLFLDGCAWSGKENRLVDSEPKKLFTPLPVLYVTGCLAKDKKKEGTYAAPAYRIKKRTGLNYIAMFDLRTEDPPSKW